MNDGVALTLQPKGLKNLNLNFNLGYLVFLKKENKLFFQDAFKKLHELERVSFLNTKWNSEEGDKELPKPYVYDETGTLISYGDVLVYGFFANSTDNMIVFGSITNFSWGHRIKNLQLDENLELLDGSASVRNNNYRYYSIKEDGKGNILLYLEGKKTDKTEGTGNISLKILGTENNGLVKLETNGNIQIAQTQQDGDNEKVVTAITMINKKGEENISVKDQYGNVINISKEGISIASKKEMNIKLEGNAIINVDKDIQIKSSGNANIEAKETTIKSGNVTITGGKLKAKGTAKPNGQGGFCALPNGQCLFTGAVITSDTLEGT